ncbi:nitrate reductase subunit alpha, partial [Paraburkholderia sp. SIMBA_054]
EEKDGKGKDVELAKSFIDKDSHDAVADVAFPYFGNREHDYFEGTDHDSVLVRKVPARKLKIKGGDVMVATVFDLFAANYGLDRGLGD